jgi:histidine triad (HIT) family protein
MNDCIFCKIVKGEIPCSKVLETDKILAFNDIHPVAPVHVLIVPKEHIATFNDVGERQKDILEEMVRAAQKIAREKGIAQTHGCHGLIAGRFPLTRGAKTDREISAATQGIKGHQRLRGGWT